MTETQPLTMTLEVNEDPVTGDHFLIFPPELLQRLQWNEGDTLIWTQLDDQSWSLHKKEITDCQDNGSS